MKRTVLVFILGAISCLSANAQQHAVTDSGRTVILNNDGTWKYEEAISEETMTQEEGQDTALDPSYKKYYRPLSSKALLKSQKNKSAIWYNAQAWRKISKPFSEASEFSLTTLKGDGYCTIVTEAVQLSYSMMKEAVVTNAQSLSSDFKVTSEEFRNVNGKKIMCLTAKASRQGVSFSFMYYIHTGAMGTTQIICYTSSNIFKDLKKDFEDLMNGFVVLH